MLASEVLPRSDAPPMSRDYQPSGALAKPREGRREPVLHWKSIQKRPRIHSPWSGIIRTSDTMNAATVTTSELTSMLSALGWEFPFERILSLAPLIRFWEDEIAPENSLLGRLAQGLQREVRAAPD